jgi:hypothetical protein
MRGFLVLLVLLGALGAAGYYTRPGQGMHRGVATALMTQGKVERPAANTGHYEFDDYYVVTFSAMSSGDKQLLQCWGLFTRFLCIGPADAVPVEGATAPA